MPKENPDRLVGTTPRQVAARSENPAPRNREDLLEDSLEEGLVDPLTVQGSADRGFGCLAGGAENVVQLHDGTQLQRADEGIEGEGLAGLGEADADAAVQGDSAADVVQARGPIAKPAAAVGKPGGRAHPGAKGEKPFTRKELTWINQVLQDRFVSLLFSSYTDVPTAVLHRVASVAGAKGQYSSKNDDIAVADKVYTHKDRLTGRNSVKFTETNEEAFKGTLIHELFHFAAQNAKLRKSGLVLPKDLITAMTYPTRASFPAYAFGWFVHPKSSYILHFQLPDTQGFNPQSSLLGHPKLRAIQKAGKWERSPMPKSGNSISVEEDVCESISLALTSKRTLGVLSSQYPQRYKLLNNYFKSLFRYAQKSRSKQP